MNLGFTIYDIRAANAAVLIADFYPGMAVPCRGHDEA
jgi:hypothetical protein